MKDLQCIAMATTVWAYWACVGAMSLRVRRRTRKLSGIVPSQPMEQLMWLVWVPLVLAWMVFPYLAAGASGPPWALPDAARQAPFVALRWAAAVLGVVCLGLSIECWLRMGKNWRMAINPDEQTDLVTTGLYARIRHPIYALSILLMLCTLAVAPIWPVAAMAVIHIGLMITKAHNEERFLAQRHGAAVPALPAAHRSFRAAPTRRGVRHGHHAMRRSPAGRNRCRHSVAGVVLWLALAVLHAAPRSPCLRPRCMPTRAKRCWNRGSSSGCWRSMRSASPSRTCARCCAQVPAPRIIALHGSVPIVTMAPFARFLVAMGYPQERVRNPRDGAFSYSSRIDSRELAGTIAWHYERDGVMPMLIGHSQGGMLAIKVLQDLAGASGAALPVWNPLRGAAEARSTIVDPLIR